MLVMKAQMEFIKTGKLTPDMEEVLSVGSVVKEINGVVIKGTFVDVPKDKITEELNSGALVSVSTKDKLYERSLFEGYEGIV